MKIAVIGASGRMGQTIVRLAVEAGDTIVGAAADRSSRDLGRDAGEVAGIGPVGVAVSHDLGAALLGADVVIDFSHASAMQALLSHVTRARVPLVSGTTRLDEAAQRGLDEAAKQLPLLWAPNTSLGVHVLSELVTEAARKLGEDFDVEIVETHHRNKVDAPSGTAVRLVEAVEAGRAKSLARVTGREGEPGKRTRAEVGVLAVRGGDVIGDHSVHFLGQGERLELIHRATGRELFARGALRAARFVVGKPAGRYTMADVVAASLA